MKALSKKTINRLSKILALFIVVVSSLSTKVYAAAVEAKIDSWGNMVVSILVKLVRFGGIFALIFIGIYLYFNSDEAGAKRGKIALFIVLLATFVAWFAPLIVDAFIK